MRGKGLERLFLFVATMDTLYLLGARAESLSSDVDPTYPGDLLPSRALDDDLGEVATLPS